MINPEYIFAAIQEICAIDAQIFNMIANHRDTGFLPAAYAAGNIRRFFGGTDFASVLKTQKITILVQELKMEAK